MKLKIFIVGTALLSAMSIQVSAGQWCRERTAHDAKSNGTGCVNASSSDKSEKDRIYDGYGAFAFRRAGQRIEQNDPDAFFETAARASDSALRRCKSGSGVDCKIVATFKNECAAAVLGVDNPSSGEAMAYVGKGGNESIAKAAARARCEASGSPVCDTAVAQCVLPWSR